MENQSITDRSNAPISGATPVPPAPTFVGNSNDVLAIAAATSAAIVAFTCLTAGYGLYCLPVVPILLGSIALVNARVSVNPDRTRRWGWISLGTGGAALLIVAAMLVLFVLVYIVMIILTTAFSMTLLPRR
jgi:hypothetical protein